MRTHWVVVACVGCYNPTIRAGAPCMTSEDCPSSLACVDQVCGGTFRADAREDTSSLPDAVPDALNMVTFVIDDPNMMRDTWMWSANPTTIYGGSSQISVDAQDNESSILSFDLTSIPSTAKVVAATVSIYTDNAADPSGGTVLAYPMLEAWTESEATYLERQTGVSWSTVNAQPPSRGTNLIGTFAPLAVATQYSFAIDSAQVETWIAEPSTNLGLILVRGTSTAHIHLLARESATPPKLTLELLVP